MTEKEVRFLSKVWKEEGTLYLKYVVAPSRFDRVASYQYETFEGVSADAELARNEEARDMFTLSIEELLGNEPPTAEYSPMFYLEPEQKR